MSTLFCTMVVVQNRDLGSSVPLTLSIPLGGKAEPGLLSIWFKKARNFRTPPPKRRNCVSVLPVQLLRCDAGKLVAFQDHGYTLD